MSVCKGLSTVAQVQGENQVKTIRGFGIADLILYGTGELTKY